MSCERRASPERRALERRIQRRKLDRILSHEKELKELLDKGWPKRFQPKE
jgi:hypothetical protein